MSGGVRACHSRGGGPSGNSDRMLASRGLPQEAHAPLAQDLVVEYQGDRGDEPALLWTNFRLCLILQKVYGNSG
jgi:hypothetical protein